MIDSADPSARVTVTSCASRAADRRGARRPATRGPLRSSMYPATVLALALVGAAFGAPRVLEWKDLVPENERNRPPVYQDPIALALREDLLEPGAQPTYGIVEALDGAEVRIPGFLVPLEAGEKGLEAAFLVPYFGACIHEPPPPPNQIVYVRIAQPFRLGDMWRPFWVEGELSTASYDDELGSAAYTLDAVKVEEYQWE